MIITALVLAVASAEPATIAQPDPPTPSAPAKDENGMELLGFGYDCTVQVGDGQTALTAKADIDLDGQLNGITARTGMVLANPAQDVALGLPPKERWSFEGTLRWEMSWYLWAHAKKEGALLLSPENGTVHFHFDGERRLPERMTMSTAQTNGSYAELSMHSGRYEKNRGFFSSYISVLLGASLSPDGISWHIYDQKSAKLYGRGHMLFATMREVLSHLDTANSQLAAKVADYKRQCTPQPIYESNEIII